MLKKALFLLLFILLGWGFVSLFMEGDEPEPITQPPVSKEDFSQSKNSLIDQIYTLSQQGGILNLPVIAGQSDYKEVTGLFGDPDTIDETSVGNYAIYSGQYFNIGFQDSTVFDLRSYTKEIQTIKYEDILQGLGEPSDIKYYQDDENDHIILIYQVNPSYQLKWVLNHPNEMEQNPAVNHISVVAMDWPKQNDIDPDLTISEQMEQMSLAEKIGQMMLVGVTGTELNQETDQLIYDYKVGGFIFNGKNMTSPSQTVGYINALKERNRENKFPLFFGIDQEGGRISKLPGELIKIPTNLEIGRMNDSSYTNELGRVLGESVMAYGFNMNFAPVLDVNSNPDNPVIGDRSFGANPHLVSKLGTELMKGLQSEKIIPTIKHFPGHGDTTVDSHLELPTIHKSLAELKELELIPFRYAIDEGADMVMIAHLLLPEVDKDYPSSLSKRIITELLRNEMGFEGVVITDDLTMEAIASNFELGKAAVMSVQAGSDIVMVAHDYEKMVQVITALKKAVEEGDISEERLNESVTRILELKKKYGISDSPRDKVNLDELNQRIEAVLAQYNEG